MDRPLRPRLPKLIFGLAVVTAGILFTLDNLDLMDAGEILAYWPVALIAMGVAGLFGGGRQQMVGSLALVGVGVWILLYNNEIVDIEPWIFFWPAILVVVGLNLVLGALRRPTAGSSESNLGVFAFWSGIDRRVNSQDFAGGDLTAIMGGIEIDLTSARIVGEPPVINVFAMWGGIEIRVPEEWAVDFEVWPLMAGASDLTNPSSNPQPPTLIIKGMALMGGVEVKN